MRWEQSALIPKILRIPGLFPRGKESGPFLHFPWDEAALEDYKKGEIENIYALRSKQRVLALPVDNGCWASLTEIARYQVAFYTGLPLSCVTVMVLDPTDPEINFAACHYNTFTRFVMESVLYDSSAIPDLPLPERWRIIDSLNSSNPQGLDKLSLLVSFDQRRKTMREAIIDAINTYLNNTGKNEGENNSTRGSMPIVLISGIAYGLPFEINDLREDARWVLNTRGLELNADRLGQSIGIYAALNHKRLPPGYGFYNHKTGECIPIGQFS